jgi:hypothetical protein
MARMTITARKQDGRLQISLPEDTIGADEALHLLQAFATLSPEQRSLLLQDMAPLHLSPPQRRYLGQLTSAIGQREAGALAFADADMYALGEADRLGIALTARQRSTLIQYYVEREPAAGPAPSGGAAAARARAIALARSLRASDGM